MPRLTTWIAVALIATFAGRQPDPRVREHIDALVAALSGDLPGGSPSGSSDGYEAMAQAHFAPALLAARTADERRSMAARVHADFGELTIQTVDAEAPGTLTIRAAGSKGGTLTLLLTLEPAAPFRIARLELQAGNPGGGRGGPAPLPPPPINPEMTSAALTPALDGYLSELSARDEFAGVVLVAKDGTRLFEKGYGPADRERQAPITLEHRFNLASIGKAFTKVAIGQLITQGKLALPDTIASKLPDYPNAQSGKATIDQLLNHTAGIADFFGPAFDAAPKDRFQSNSDYFRLVSTEPPLFAPGAENRYCNGCYIVLGEIITRVSGQPYERYVADHVFTPAGMTGAGFAAYGDPQVAPGYTRLGPANGTLSSNAPMHGRHGSAAGGAFARAADLLAFDNALRDGRLLDAKMTGWFFDGPPATAPRARGAIGLAGGAPGANAALEADGTWTIIVTGNLDPPNAARVAAAIRRQLQR